MTETKAGLPLDLEGLSPEDAARALKRHNPRLTESTEFLAETIRQVRAGETEPEGEVTTLVHELLASGN